jgi:hypothetical protein
MLASKRGLTTTILTPVRDEVPLYIYQLSGPEQSIYLVAWKFFTLEPVKCSTQGPHFVNHNQKINVVLNVTPINYVD